MKYQGGKAKQAQYIGPIINRFLGGKLDYFEPFVGGFNLVPYVHTKGKIWCGDLNPMVISMYQALAKGWLPPENVTKELFDAAKEWPDDDPRKAFVRIGCSFRGSGWVFSGLGVCRSTGQYHDYPNEARTSILAKLSHYARVHGFDCRSYDEWKPESKPSVIYCDPPYDDRRGYKPQLKANHKPFDAMQFWQWAQIMGSDHYVLVSEYSCPIDHAVAWERPRRSSMTHKETDQMAPMERLYLIGKAAERVDLVPRVEQPSLFAVGL